MKKRLAGIAAMLALEVVVLGLFGAAYLGVVRPWHRNWGATPEEIKAEMPADELVAQPNYRTTRAIIVRGDPEDIWPWLVQMGYKRGGLYSYDWLDRLQKILDAPSATAILPEFQKLGPGDEIPIGGGTGWPVSSLEPNRSLVLDVRQPGVHISWSWLLVPVQEDVTRIVLRIKGRLDLGPQTLPLLAILDPGEFAMVRKMLTGIKSRVEGTAGTPGQELFELLMWSVAILCGLAGFIGSLVMRQGRVRLLAVSWASLLVVFLFVLGQPPLAIGAVLNIVLCSALAAAFSRGRGIA